MRQGRAGVVSTMGLLVLVACSPAPTPAPALAKPQAAAAPAPASSGLWRYGASASPVTAEYGLPGAAVLVVSCDHDRRLVRFAFPQAPEDAYGPETAILRAGPLELHTEVRFRSAEDVAKSDPPAWIEIPASARLAAALRAAPNLRIERGDVAHTVIDAGIPGPPAKLVTETCV